MRFYRSRKISHISSSGLLRAIPALVFLMAASPAYAVRPFITDDARVVGKHLGQVETWLRIDNAGLQHWILPAYGPTDWLELTAGAYHGFAGQNYSIAGPLLQIKFLLRDAMSNEFPGVALAAGSAFNAGFGPFLLPQISPYAYAAFTHNLFDERVLTHINFGIVQTVRFATTWGVGQQIRVVGDFHAVWEVISGDPYAEQSTGGATQVGIRYLVSPSIQLDATFGTGLWEPRLPSWGSAGLRWVFG